MKALFYTGTQKTDFRDTDDATIEEGESLIAVSHCGICGSDMHAWHGHDERRVPPLILGHEAAGTVVEGQYQGKRVVVNPLMSCGDCKMCTSGAEHLCASRELIGMRKAGAFAESVAVKSGNLTVIPDSLSFDQASLAEPLAVAVHAVELGLARMTETASGLSAIVIGGGAIGLLVAKVLEVRGLTNIYVAETNDLRTSILNEATRATTYNPMSGNAPVDQVDLVFDAVGMGATRAASSALVRPGGAIVHIGLQDNEPGLDTRRITLQEIAFIGAYCYTSGDFAAATDLLATGKITRDGWSEIRPLSAGGTGFQDIHDGKAMPKIILEI